MTSDAQKSDSINKPKILDSSQSKTTIQNSDKGSQQQKIEESAKTFEGLG